MSIFLNKDGYNVEVIKTCIKDAGLKITYFLVLGKKIFVVDLPLKFGPEQPRTGNT